jgi:hypothetical protein
MGTYTMTTKFLIHVITMSLSVFLNYFSDLIKFSSRFNNFDSLIHSFPCNFTQPVNIRMYLYLIGFHQSHSRIISVHTLLIANYVNVDIVTWLNYITVWNSMTDAVINS